MDTTDSGLTTVTGPVVLTRDQLSQMSLTQVQAFYASNIQALNDQKTQYSIDDQIATALCLRMQQLNSQCTGSNPVVPDGGSGLICDPSQTDQATSLASPFKVVLTDTSGTMLTPANFPGQYILVANTLYESTPFGAGATTISFSYKGSGNAPSPLLMQLTSLEIRNAKDTVTGTYSSDILNGKGTPLPAISSFYVQLNYNNKKLTDGSLIPNSNSSYTNYRYVVSLKTIFDEASSVDCKVTQAEVNDIKTQITSSIQSAASESSSANGPTTAPVNATKDQLIAGILDAQSRMATAAPLIQNDENRILNFTGELQVYQTVGCHASEPLKQLTIQVFGKKNDPKLLTDNYAISETSTDSCPVVNPQGSSSTLEFSMGPSVVVDIDTSKIGVVGGSWTGPIQDQSLVGGMHYLRISKLGVGIAEAGKVCKVGFLGVSQTCGMTCNETDTFSITGVKIQVQTPSTQSPTTVYDNESLNITLASVLYAPNAVISWTAADFHSDPNWIAFMSATNCDSTK